MNVICPRVPDCDRPLSCLASSRPFSFELIGLGVMTYPTRESDCRQTLVTFDNADLLWIRYFMERSHADELLFSIFVLFGLFAQTFSSLRHLCINFLSLSLNLGASF